MTAPKGHGPVLLDSHDAARESHATLIQALDEKAKRLVGIYNESRGSIFAASQSGYGTDIVCDREHGDDAPSVSRLYFGTAVYVQRQESNAGNNPANFSDTLCEQRELVEETLAVHLSVNRHKAGLAAGLSADNTTAEYLQHIRGLEKFCKTNGLTSLLPNTFLHSSFSSQFHTPQYVQAQEEVRTKLYDRVLGLFQCQPYHLASLVTPFFQNGDGEFAIQLLQKVCTWRKTSITDLCAENIALAQLYANYQCKCGRHREVIELAGSLDLRGIQRHAGFFQVFLNACVESGDFATAKAHIEKHNLRVVPDHPSLCEAMRSACTGIAWWMLGQGQYSEGMEFLSRYAARDLAVDGTDVRVAYDELKKTLKMPKKKEKK